MITLFNSSYLLKGIDGYINRLILANTLHNVYNVYFPGNTVIPTRTSNNPDVYTQNIPGRKSVCFVPPFHWNGRDIMDISPIEERSYIRTTYILNLNMTSENGKIFRVTDHLWGDPPVTGGFPSQRPETRIFDVYMTSGLCVGNSPVTAAQMASYVENFPFDGVIIYAGWLSISPQGTHVNDVLFKNQQFHSIRSQCATHRCRW